MMKSGAKVERKDSDEWLCSSTYQPSREEIVQKSAEKRKTKKKKISVVVPRLTSVKLSTPLIKERKPTFETPKEVFTIDEAEDMDILNFVSTSKANSFLKTPSSSMAKIKIISPAIPRTVSSIREFSPPVLQIRQSPEQLFAALTPKRRSSLELTLPSKRRKTDEQDPFEYGHNEEENIEENGSTNSDISNVFDTLSPIETPENSPHKLKFSLDFITGYEAQFSAFEDTQPPIDEGERNVDSPDLFDDLEDPMSIYEESEARDLNCSPMKIETSPEKPKKVNFNFFESEEVKAVKKTIRFAEPEEPSLWRKENFIEESCAAHLQNSVFREYAIDVETCGMQFAESSALPGDDEETQKYLNAESCALLANSPISDSQEEEIYERDELSGLSARFASLMSSATSERRLLMSDVVFGTVPKEKLVKLELCSSIQSAFGMTILDTSPSSVIISRSSAIRRLANTTAVPCSSSLSPAPFVCDPAPSFHLPPAATPTSSLIVASSLPPPTLAPISTILSIGALHQQSSSSESATTTTKIEDSQKGRVQVVINPPCQCTKAYSGIPCYHSWCEVRSNATHIAACAVAKKNGSNTQTLACALVTERADEGKCQYDGKRNFTKCWCTRGDYCNVDLVDRIRDKRDDEEDDYDGFSVETNTEFNENNNDIGSDEDVEDSQEFRTGAPRDVVPERIDAVDMRKPVETKQPDPEDLALPPWRRMNPLNADREWKPPPPPPMPGKHPILPPTTTTSTTSTTTTTTTTTTAPPTTTTTTGPSYEEIMRQYEERRRQNEMQREAELKRRAEVERQRLEERRHLESQHEQRRRFGEETRNWPVAPMAPEAQDPTTTTSTTTRTMPTTTTTTTTTTTAPPTTTATTTTTTPRPTTTTKPAPKEEKSYESYYRNWKPHRRPLDLNPTQVSIQSVSAIVYPPKNFVKATKSTTSTTTTTTTPAPTTTTQPIIYPPANFKKATKLTSTTTTTTTTTTTPRTITTTEMAFTLPRSDDEDGDDEEMYEKERKMVEMPKVESEEVDSVVMYTPRPPPNRLPPPPPTPSVRTPVEKMDEYKKLLAAQEPSSSAVSMIIPSFISIIILYLL